MRVTETEREIVFWPNHARLRHIYNEIRKVSFQYFLLFSEDKNHQAEKPQKAMFGFAKQGIYINIYN